MGKLIDVQLDLSTTRSPGRMDSSGEVSNFQQEVEKQVKAVIMCICRDAASITQQQPRNVEDLYGCL